MEKQSMGFLIAQRLITTLATLLIVILLMLEIVFALVAYIPFYLMTGLPTPMFHIVEWAGERLSKYKYVQDV